MNLSALDLSYLFNNDILIQENLLLKNSSEIKFIKGNSNSKVVFALGVPITSKADQILLNNLISACKIDEYALVVQDDMNKLTQVFKGQIIVYFSETNQFDPKFLNKPFTKEKHQFVLTYSLSILNSDKALKAQLWNNGLKNLFKL